MIKEPVFLEQVLCNGSDGYALYRSPLREDTHPSFKVDTEKNLWIDYADGRGGSIIDLYMRLEGCTLSEARRSVKTHLKWLYTYEEYPELEIPNTTNLLEGFNSQLKRALRNHNGMKEVNKKKFIDGFLNIKK